MWVIRAGRGAEHIDDFVQKNVVAFGDDRLGKLPVPVTKDQLLQIYAEKFPEEKDGTRASWASQLLRLVNEVKIGDDAACFDRDRRRYILGKVMSECEWLPNVVPNKPNVRRVEWSREVFRDALSPATKNTLGSSLTVFKLNAEAAKDMVTHAVPLGSAPPPVAPQPSTPDAERNEAALGQISADTFVKANEFIEDEIDRLDWKQMQELVAGILRAMGYRTTVSDAGPDRGVDVFASRDGLGLEEPRTLSK